MKVNLEKSFFMVFTRSRKVLSAPPDILMDGVPLSYRSHARYLGLWFSSDLSWSFHAQQVLAKAKCSANLIVRRARDVPSLRVVRSLVLAITRGVIAYGFPIWEPSPSCFLRLQAQILRPLRAALGLPQSAHSDSVLSEFGVCSLRRYWEQQAIAWAARMTRIVKQEPLDAWPAARLFRQRHAACFLPEYHRLSSPHLPSKHVHPHKPGPGRCSLPFRAVSLKQDWEKGTDKIRRKPMRHLPLLGSSTLKSLAVSLSYRDWRVSEKGSLHPYRGDDLPGLAHYLLTDDRPVACLRARLRFGRSGLRAHRHRLGLEDSATCEHCLSGADETADHALLSCDKYSAVREKLSQDLRRLDIASLYSPLTSSLILGRVVVPADGPADLRRNVLLATGRFLSAINDLRSDSL